MTHDEITALQAKYAGSSRGPGKFQGESDWAVYYWDKVMDGCEDYFLYDPYDGTPISVFRVDKEDRLIYPELKNMVEVWLWEDDQGFVVTRTFGIGEDTPSWDDTHSYDVVVSTIGSVNLGASIRTESDARSVYKFYVEASKNYPGCRAYKQDVTLLIDDEIVEEWTGYPGENDIEPRDSE